MLRYSISRGRPEELRICRTLWAQYRIARGVVSSTAGYIRGCIEGVYQRRGGELEIRGWGLQCDTLRT
jgi:hypothetical protein